MNHKQEYVHQDKPSNSGINPLVALCEIAFGCKDFVPPEGTNMERHGDSAVVMCNATHETWYLTCDDNGEWKGSPGNCTSGKVHDRLKKISR